MTKPLNKDSIAQAMRDSPNLAKNGTPEQKAGMFRPEQTKIVQPPKKRRSA